MNAPLGIPDDLEQQRARLQAEIAAAGSRAQAARHRSEINDVAARSALRVELAATREQLDEMERRHQAAVAAIRESAKREVDRILAEARMVAAGATRVHTRPASDVE
jgi:hypothetical protein